MDTQKIQKVCDEYLAYRESEFYLDNSDWDNWIFETVMQAVFGKSIWERFRKIDDKRQSEKSKRKSKDYRPKLIMIRIYHFEEGRIEDDRERKQSNRVDRGTSR